MIDGITAHLAPAAPPEANAGGRARNAAEEFEGLLLGQLLRGMRESGSGWLGTGDDQAGECAMDLAEQQVALVLARRGGLGLSALIAGGLERKP